MEAQNVQKNKGIHWVLPKDDIPKNCDPVLAVIEGRKGLEDLSDEYTIASHSNTGWMLEDLNLDDFKVLLWAGIPEYDPENTGLWIPVEKRLPKTTNNVLVMFHGECNGFIYEEDPAVASYDEDGWKLKDVQMDSFEVLAWINILNW